MVSGPSEVLTFVVVSSENGQRRFTELEGHRSFSDLVSGVLQKAHAKCSVDFSALRPSLTEFLRQQEECFRNSVAVVKLGEDAREWLEPDGQYIRSALATVHSLLLTWREQQPWPGDAETAAILAERVVFPFHDNVIAAHDHQMDDGDRLLFNAKKCRIIFGTSPINGDRRFSLWYEMLAEQFAAASPKFERLALEVSERVADAKAQVFLAMEQEKMQSVDKLRDQRRLERLRSCWMAWTGRAAGAGASPESQGASSSSSRQGAAAAPGAAVSREELRRRLRRQVRERGRAMAH